MVRKPAVAGRFYPGNRSRLEAEVRSYFDEGTPRVKSIGVVSPHAGYVYSGKVAGRVFSRVEVPRRVVVMGPNHRGVGGRIALMSEGAWETPLGDVSLDGELAAKLTTVLDIATEDSRAHTLEHSLEVQLPFLQAVRTDILLLPIALGGLNLELCLALGDALAEVIDDVGEDVLMVASSDMTHYEPDKDARAKDREVIDQMLALDPEGVFRTVKEKGITMCGVIPVTAMLRAAQTLGAAHAELVDYMTSGDTSGDYSSVVGYAGLIVR
ncbi:MAG: AmmeMemoRadiSam system protein B [Deltaproteobacteria bacterium]|nr:AmmeMemoRadiSam system protein B [Candidatus Zymogenaceae bacterium]